MIKGKSVFTFLGCIQKTNIGIETASVKIKFNRFQNDMFSTLDHLDKNNQELTIIIDKGMNSEANMELIDKREGTEFITTYSPAFVEDLIKKI